MAVKENYKVYMFTFPNNKVYIGITGRSVNERWGGGKNYHKETKIRNAIDKYGWVNIKKDVLFEGLSKEEAERKEIELIAKYNSTDIKNGYNHATGGAVNSGFHLSEETKKRLSEIHKGNIPWNKGKADIYSMETRAEMAKELYRQIARWHKASLGVCGVITNGKRTKSN